VGEVSYELYPLLVTESDPHFLAPLLLIRYHLSTPLQFSKNVAELALLYCFWIQTSETVGEVRKGGCGTVGQ
jgi:hypothetical protein